MIFDFVIPSWKYWENPLRAQPLTQMYLATILEDMNHEIIFTDFRDGPKKLPKADAHFYTVASPDFEEIKEIIKNNPGTHIAGGPHANIFPEKCLKVFNAICIGRGEESIKQMARDLGEKRLQRKYCMPTKKIYPYPKRHFLSREKIITSLFKTQDIPSTTVLFSHGCPFRCSFCANYNRGQIERRSLKSISEEINYLKKEYGIKGLSLQDEICIPPNPLDAFKFLRILKSKNILWRGQVRAGIPNEILRAAKESGCAELSFGLESVDQKTLDLTGKGIRIENVKLTLKQCKENNIKTRLYLLNGLPGEPKDIVRKTKEFITRNKPDMVLLSTLQPYPGSEIYNHPEKYGIKWIDKDFSKYNHLRCRFKDSKDNVEESVPFEYEKGKGFTRQQIMDNLIKLQEFLRERGMNK